MSKVATKYSACDIEYLYNTYADGDNKALAKILGRSVRGIQHKAAKLGLKKYWNMPKVAVGPNYDIPDDIRDRIIKTIGTCKAAGVTDKNVIPLFKDLLAKNDLNGRFTLHKNYLTEVTGRKDSKVIAGYKRALIGAGLIEAVPLEELGVKTRYAFNRKDAQGKPMKGRAEVFRFTALTKSMAGESVF